MLELQNMTAEAKRPRDEEFYEREIKSRDREIDRRVY